MHDVIVVNHSKLFQIHTRQMVKMIRNKKILLTVICAVGLSCCFISCNDDDKEVSQMHKKSVQQGKISTFSYMNGGEHVTMLEFVSKEDFLSTIEQLEVDNSAYNDNFYSKFSDEFAKDSTFCVVEEDYGFDNQVVYKQFEKQFDYKSMRSIYSSLEDKWLDDIKVDLDNHPFKIYPYSTEEQTLFNQYGEVKIGDTILKVVQGDYIAFGDCDTNALVKYNFGDKAVLKQNNIIGSFKFRESSEYCKYKESVAYELYPIRVNGIILNAFKTYCFISFYNCWFYAKANIKSKFFAYNSSKKKYVSAGTNQMLSSSRVALYDMYCENNVENMERGYVRKCAHELKISRKKREWLNHYRAHDYGHSISVSYKVGDTPSTIFFMKFWDPNPISMDC